MQGLHLTADLRGCATDSSAMSDPQALKATCLAAVRGAKLQAVAELFHAFDAHAGGPSGVTGVVLLAESHLAVHTWPERGAVTLDVYVCNLRADNSERARRLLEALIAAFEPNHRETHELLRGAAP